MKNKVKLGIFIVALGGLLLVPKLFSKSNSETLIETISVPSLIEIQLYGEINLPGVYKVQKGTTYQTLFNYALGPTLEADLTSFNLSEPILEAVRIEIPRLDEVALVKININQASIIELMTLPGIGEVTANRIVDYRNQNGAFIAIEALKNVSGIGEQTFEKLKRFITI
ncbi:MAG: helix-hairpin-helix domain-containing protein [Acholeplasma sp.]|nr:helix-hairpin-helix domain-containing protein [Acholeplasma sp.]